eukprot:1318070-Amorphochlora_amoeboformis.AAC.2
MGATLDQNCADLCKRSIAGIRLLRDGARSIVCTLVGRIEGVRLRLANLTAENRCEMRVETRPDATGLGDPLGYKWRHATNAINAMKRARTRQERARVHSAIDQSSIRRQV